MGEARRRKMARINASAEGSPVPRIDECPACRSRKIGYGMFEDQHFDRVEYGVCTDCEAVWEAFPAMMVEDPVCAEPCDNCAFRPGSPEQEDKEGWKALIASLDPRPSDYGMTSGGRFYCHKGVPIDMVKGPGNFLFPKRQLAPDIAPGATTQDTSRMRVCSGFLRMFWAKAAKAEKEAAS
jgi:hypothetical protein